MRSQHLEVVRQGHVTIIASQGTGKRVAVIRMESELSVVEFGPGVIHPTVCTENVVTRGEHKDHGTRVGAGQAGHVSDVAPYQVQSKCVVSVTATGYRTMRHVATPEVEHSPDRPLTRLTVGLDPLRLEDILPGAGILLEDAGAGLTISASQPQLGGREAVCLVTPAVEHGEAGLPRPLSLLRGQLEVHQGLGQGGSWRLSRGGRMSWGDYLNTGVDIVCNSNSRIYA